MIILDTDLVSLLQRSSPEAPRILDRIQIAERTETVATTIITYEEQTRGWFKLLKNSRSMQEEIEAYGRLMSHIEYFCNNKVVAFNAVSAVQLRRLRGLRLRIGTMDLKISAIALANDATVWSRNLRDFGKVPGLRVEDVTR